MEAMSKDASLKEKRDSWHEALSKIFIWRK
jgi:hypothetical protein